MRENCTAQLNNIVFALYCKRHDAIFAGIDWRIVFKALARSVTNDSPRRIYRQFLRGCKTLNWRI